MDSPEERARINIDRLLAAAGWEVQDRRRANLGAATGVAVREFPLETGEADYLLFVRRKAIGGVEAKPESQVIVRDDLWTSTSNNQLNFVQHQDYPETSA